MIGRILVACEESGIVRDAFVAKGWDAWSADLKPSKTLGQHFQGDVREILYLPWDLIIAHPPCTYLANVGQGWLHSQCPERWPKFLEAVNFFLMFLNLPTEHICVENPRMHKWATEQISVPHTQEIQPWQFGHEAQKATRLWLKNLPKLKATKIVGKGEFYIDPRGRRHSVFVATQNRSQEARSVTFLGIASAMAEQWTEYFEGKATTK